MDDAYDRTFSQMAQFVYKNSFDLEYDSERMTVMHADIFTSYLMHRMKTRASFREKMPYWFGRSPSTWIANNNTA